MKKLDSIVKLQIKAEEANPSPPIGPALGAKGINIMNFCKEFNIITSNIKTLEKGTIVPVVVTIYTDKSFKFIIKSPPVSILIKKILKLKKGSSNPNKKDNGFITYKHIEDIIEIKQKDLIVNSKKAAMKSIIGTAKSMGLIIKKDI